MTYALPSTKLKSNMKYWTVAHANKECAWVNKKLKTKQFTVKKLQKSILVNDTEHLTAKQAGREVPFIYHKKSGLYIGKLKKGSERLVTFQLKKDKSIHLIGTYEEIKKIKDVYIKEERNTFLFHSGQFLLALDKSQLKFLKANAKISTPPWFLCNDEQRFDFCPISGGIKSMKELKEQKVEREINPKRDKERDKHRTEMEALNYKKGIENGFSPETMKLLGKDWCHL